MNVELVLQKLDIMRDVARKLLIFAEDTASEIKCPSVALLRSDTSISSENAKNLEQFVARNEAEDNRLNFPTPEDVIARLHRDENTVTKLMAELKTLFSEIPRLPLEHTVDGRLTGGVCKKLEERLKQWGWKVDFNVSVASTTIIVYHVFYDTAD